MRRDVYIENDSGGFSVVAADAVDAIIEDQRSDDMRFVAAYKALLLELYGDDSMIVRIVVDEPLSEDEEAQWLARATWRIDTTDGRMLAMGGFDPDVLSWWKDADTSKDGRGVALFQTGPGSWRVDVYAHVGSMNGRAILSDDGDKPGTAFRRSHPGRAFPMWLARMLEFSGEEDPGFEEDWRDVKAAIAAGRLAVDVDGPDAVGMLVHVTRDTNGIGAAPDEIWFGRTDNSRIPAAFPLGLASNVADPNVDWLRDTLLDRKRPTEVRPVATEFTEIIEAWPGKPLAAVVGGSVSLPVNDFYLLHWIASLGADSPPRFELRVESHTDWPPPASTPDFAVAGKSGGVVAIGPVTNTGGWHTWWTSRDLAAAMPALPDGTTLTLGTLRTSDDAYGEDEPSDVGRMLYSGTVHGGTWDIAEASPTVTREILSEAIAFATNMAKNGRITVRAGAEREAFEGNAAMFAPDPDSLVWEGDVVRVAEPDERTTILLASPVFRTRFATQWKMDTEEEEDDDS